MTISNESRDRFKHAFEPIALAMGRAGLTPDALTLIGFAITIVGAAILSQQQWLVGGLVVLVGGVFDMFDGTLARATGKVSRLGAFMDSVFDRWGEALVYLGIVVGCSFAGFAEGAYFAAAAMGAAFMVSYTRAKAEGLGFTTGTGMAAIGIMPREVRLVVLSLGLILAPMPIYEALPPNEACMGPCDFPQGGSLSVALGIIIIGSTITTIQRIIHVRNQARQQSSSQPTENAS
ncbi:MAG: CDP-alcohol phosphatidyltransferase family protein [Chloroflexota bacterium]